MDIQQTSEAMGVIVSLDDAKRHCRADDFGDDDALISLYIDAAVDWVQSVCQTRLERAEFTAAGSCFDLDFAGYPDPEIISVGYIDDLGAAVTLDTSRYALRDGRLVVYGAENVASARVEFVAGLGPGNVPARLVQAMRMLIAHWYLNREAVGTGMAQVPLGVRDMVATYRSFAFG
ncbi:head-tail connector protein [Ketogulonicigenium vulgare]|uniref:head-tail connector protein n=1 Tax=Ketogulonicigenium vulgare TaxID=92945 RepID=UPI00235824E4|nr:head-tail connector protein [Ketogulonicigenium vulgare]